jgi:hypothetical protein
MRISKIAIIDQLSHNGTMVINKIPPIAANIKPNAPCCFPNLETKKSPHYYFILRNKQ